MNTENNIDALLGAEELEDIQLTPTGSWKSELISVSRKKPKDEDANYSYRYTLTWEPQEPGDDVDEDDATTFMESDDFDGVRIFDTFFVSNKRDVLRLKRILEMAGFSGSLDDAVDEIKGGYWNMTNVVHEPDFRTGEPSEAISGYAPAE